MLHVLLLLMLHVLLLLLLLLLLCLLPVWLSLLECSCLLLLYAWPSRL
jgi:hypothetical protein